MLMVAMIYDWRLIDLWKEKINISSAYVSSPYICVFL